MRKTPIGFMFINTALGAEDKVLNNLLKISRITEAHVVYGNFDIIAKVDAPNVKEISSILSDKIRQWKNVRSTITAIVIE